MNNGRSGGSDWSIIALSSWSTSLLSLLLAGLSLGVAAVLAWDNKSPLALTSSRQSKEEKDTNNHSSNQQCIRFACVGNSMQYYNDCPRLLACMFRAAGFMTVEQDSCLKGGASLVSLWQKGNGMRTKFGTENALQPDGSYDIGAPTIPSLLKVADVTQKRSWDVCIMNDHTQSPAREETRTATTRVLEQHYEPLLFQSKTTPILVMTPAYRLPNIRGTIDLGNFEEYTQLLQKGMESYKQTMDAAFEKRGSSLRAWIAPVGLAFAHVRKSNPSLWEKLYHTDDFHPSPHGTLLQAYVLFLTIVTATNKSSAHPPLDTYDPIKWWEDARRMQPPDEPPLARPTLEEARILRDAALQVCREYHP